MKYNSDIHNYKAKLFFMFMMFIWCGSTTPVLKIISAENILFCLPHLLILTIYLAKYTITKGKNSIRIIFYIIFIWWILQCIKHGTIVGMDVMLIVQTIPVYIAYNLYKGKEFFYLFEKVLARLAFISIIVWALGCIANSYMKSLFDIISIWDNGCTTYGHLGFVGLGNQRAIGMSIIRNIGFTWEAGRFSGFLVIGLFVNLLLNRMQIFPIVNNKNFWILLVGLISTFSTTGYGAAIGVILLYIMNKGIKYKIPVIVLTISLIPVVWGMGFFSDKIIAESDTEKEVNGLLYDFNNGVESITPGRLTGAYLEWQNFINDPLLGYNKNEYSYCNTTLFPGCSLWLSNGWIQILSKYGLFFGLFFYFLLFKSSFLLSRIFDYRGRYLFFLVFVLINISYSYWDTCIMLYFVYLFLHKNYFKLDYE